ncbi:uncharacterized protein LOC123546538 [Mercenaria mercenaria]|uniref:uncharacterized protein LOC123546538 n=1 Tax=Mercenaria mercenaria TaxID=6596 RepID=UPI00234EA228|nr:uncharacterized protein LOC123546538 [Mercenaria mercenaria]
MASPLSKGLFHKGWMASGSPWYDKLAKDAYQDNLVYLNNTKCFTVDCLLALTSQEATEAFQRDKKFPNFDMYDQDAIPKKLSTRFDGSMAIVDGYVVPEPPFEAFASGFKMDIPFLVGSAGQEMDGDTPPSDMGTWNRPDYERFVHQQLDTFSTYIADMALKMYPVTANLSARYQWASMVSDIKVNCGSNLVALMAAKTFSSPVYRYVDTNRPSEPFGDGGSIYPFHTHDVYTFFGYLSSYLSPLSKSDKKFDQNMKNKSCHRRQRARLFRCWVVKLGTSEETRAVTEVFNDSSCG